MRCRLGVTIDNWCEEKHAHAEAGIARSNQAAIASGSLYAPPGVGQLNQTTMDASYTGEVRALRALPQMQGGAAGKWHCNNQRASRIVAHTEGYTYAASLGFGHRSRTIFLSRRATPSQSDSQRAAGVLRAGDQNRA